MGNKNQKKSYLKLPSLVEQLKTIKSSDICRLDFEKFDINAVNEFGENALIYIFMRRQFNHSDFNAEQIDYLVKHSDYGTTSEYGQILTHFLLYNYNNINFSFEQIQYILKHSDLNYLHDKANNPLMLAVENNSDLNLDIEHFRYMVYRSNLLNVNLNNDTALILVLACWEENNLNFDNELLGYMILNSNLKHVDKDGINTLQYLLNFNIDNQFNLTDSQMNYLFDNSDLDNYPHIIELFGHVLYYNHKIGHNQLVKLFSLVNNKVDKSELFDTLLIKPLMSETDCLAVLWPVIEDKKDFINQVQELNGSGKYQLLLDNKIIKSFLEKEILLLTTPDVVNKKTKNGFKI